MSNPSSPPLHTTLTSLDNLSLSTPPLPSSPQLVSSMESLSLCSQLDLGVMLPSPHYSPTALPLPPHLPTPPFLNLSLKKRHLSTSRKQRKVKPYQACKPSKLNVGHSGLPPMWGWVRCLDYWSDVLGWGGEIWLGFISWCFWLSGLLDWFWICLLYKELLQYFSSSS